MMTIEERKEYGDSIIDDLRMLIMLKRFDMEINPKQIWCVNCRDYVNEDINKHLARHVFGTSTPPPEFS